MNMRKLSINKACILLGTLLLLAVGAVCAAVYLLTQNITAVRCVFLFSLFVLLCVIFFVALIRRKLVRFSDAFCGQMDDMLSENMQPKQTTCEESLFYKINYRLGRLYEVMQENKNSIAKERTDLQELISDISHQVKTPIANLKMINNTLLENEVPPQKQKEFLTAQASQLDKLDFLMQAMIKTSRLETGVISLEQRQQPIYDTLAAALGGILLNAEKKKIDVQVECPEHLDARHDRKWTSEALFNILDNAVKYTPAGGQIRVSVEGWEMYVKIDIADTGIGISEQHQGTIFKRFYREDVVHDVEDGIRWLKRAAENGNQFAAYQLGKEYYRGKTIGRNLTTAAKWFEHGAQAGNQYAQYMLGKLYLMGQGVEYDKELGADWLSKSAAQGNVYAQALLQRQDSGRPPHVFLGVTRLLHHMSRIFQERSLPQSGTGLQVDSKLRQKIREKKIAMGHRPDDHEDPELNQGGMGGMTGY